VEGDWSSASYFLALGALSPGVTIESLDPDSLQGDKMMLNWLTDMGALVTAGDKSITVQRGNLKPLQADLTDCIDLLPTVAALAAAVPGTSVLGGIAAARIKESDRVAAVREGLSAMGVNTEEEENRLVIHGGRPRSGVIDSRGDHRIAMAFSVPGTLAGDTTINGAECVSKTFPGFWDILESSGGKLARNE
jgi:3-phosphoshikimate 1-carboxyvinyltransferase